MACKKVQKGIDIKMKCLVFDFGGSSVKYAVVDDRARILFSDKLPAPLESEDAFIGMIKKVYEQHSRDLDGIALSLPGIIDSESGKHYGSGAYSQILKDKNIIEMVSEGCHTKAAVENDGKCGALSEAWTGALADVKDGAVLILGTGIGGGVIVNKKIHRGLNFSAGEFSFAITKFNEYTITDEAWVNIGIVGMTYKICKWKNLDISYQDAGDTLVRYDKLLKKDFPVHTEPPKKFKVDGKQIFKWIDEKDEDAQRVYKEFLHSMIALIHNIQTCFAPSKIVIGGGLSRVERLIPDINRELEQFYSRCCIPNSLHANLCRSKYLDECNLLGAMYNFIEQYGR